jgi:competence protein ComEA
LDGIKGIGPALSAKVLAARQKGAFQDWADLMRRVKGISSKSAAKLSAEGLTVQGQPFGGATPALPQTPSATGLTPKP